MQNWVTIYTFSYPHEAYVIKGKLESEEIPVVLKDEFTIQVDNFYSNALNGVKLQVMESDVEDAVAIMKEGGYVFEESLAPSGFMNKFDEATVQFPGLKNRSLIWRFIIVMGLLIGVLITLYYFISKP